MQGQRERRASFGSPFGGFFCWDGGGGCCWSGFFLGSFECHGGGVLGLGAEVFEVKRSPARITRPWLGLLVTIQSEPKSAFMSVC
jgi:hypothetical protein